MTHNISTAEQFLAAFNDADPGITTRAIANLSVLKDGQPFHSTYDCLAAEIPASVEPCTFLDRACALCRWLEDTYDYHMLDSENQRSLNSKSIEFVETQCGNGGTVEFTNNFYLVTAVAA